MGVVRRADRPRAEAGVLSRPLLQLLAAAALVCAGACHQAHYVWVNQRMPSPKPVGELTVIGVGDLVDVMVYDDEKMSTKTRVLPDGTLTIPVLGAVPAAGKNAEQLQKELELALRKYLQMPKVTVAIEESQISVSVIGEVHTPGVVTLVTPANVLQALAKAGGLTEFASSSGIYVLRTEQGKTERIRFEYDWLVDAEPAAIGFALKTGDVIVVK